MTSDPSRAAASALDPPGAIWDGRRFHNQGGPAPHGFAAVLRWMLQRQRTPWPREVAQPQQPPPITRVEEGLRVTLIGHATVLIQVAGLNLLTDPVWSARVGPTSWLGVRRVRAPAIAFAQLPRIDAVLLSHNHYDHLDRPTLAHLEARDQPLVITGLRVARAVPCRRVVELDWWQEHRCSDSVHVRFVPAQHFSGRGMFDRNASLWGGFVIECPAGRIYFAGDTGAGAHVEQIRQRCGAPRLALLPIGAYEPQWFMSPVHINPREAVQASQTLEAQLTLGIHYGTFPLADEGIDAPALAVRAALDEARQRGPVPDFRLLPWGEALVLEPNLAQDPQDPGRAGR